MTRPYVIGGNWKLQVTSLSEAKRRLEEIDSHLEHFDIETFIAVPSVFLYSVSTQNLKLAAEDIHYEESGAYTGATSVLSLVDAGIGYTLVGHSERRIIFRETDEEINKKVKLALKYDITPVLCIGETAKERETGEYGEVLRRQLVVGLQGVENLEKVIIAYEPVWAINNKALNPDTEIKPATPADAEATHSFVRSVIEELYGQNISQSVRILYGGSMKASNAEELLKQPNIDGGLIGGASLKAETLIPVHRICSSLN